MSKKSFAALYAKLESTPDFQASAIAVQFLADVHARMQAQGMTQVELARKLSVSPAYITKLFRGSANLSVETMAKFSAAVDCKVHLHLASSTVNQVRWFDVVAKRPVASVMDGSAAGFIQTMRNLKSAPMAAQASSSNRLADNDVAPYLIAA